jgi:shikimate kinase
MSIFLIGLMGAGKTTVGKLLAHSLAYEWLDCDKILENRSGCLIKDIFEHHGEAIFREQESQLLGELTQLNQVVLSTGGGVILREDNRNYLLSRGMVVYLQSDPHDLWLRTRHDKNRPILQGVDARQKMFDLYEQRHPLYKSTAHITLVTGRSSVKEVVEQVQSAFELFIQQK